MMQCKGLDLQDQLLASRVIHPPYENVQWDPPNPIPEAFLTLLELWAVSTIVMMFIHNGQSSGIEWERTISKSEEDKD